MTDTGMDMSAGGSGVMMYVKNQPMSALGSTASIRFSYSGNPSYNTCTSFRSGNCIAEACDCPDLTNAIPSNSSSQAYYYSGSGSRYVAAGTGGEGNASGSKSGGGGGTSGRGKDGSTASGSNPYRASGGTGGDGYGGYQGGWADPVGGFLQVAWNTQTTIPISSIFEGDGRGGDGYNRFPGGAGSYGRGATLNYNSSYRGNAPGYGAGGHGGNPSEDWNSGGQGIVLIYYHTDRL